MRITFLGATQTVTGSKFLLTSGSSNILVDCGLFQGYKALRLRNRDKLPLAPARIDAVVLTHAHLDHSGYIPLLVHNGFRGKIHCSEATWDLCKILLPDSGRLLEEEAAYANRKGFSRHHPALPLYTEEDARRALQHFAPQRFGKRFKVSHAFEAEMANAGHILGAAIVTVHDANTAITFSGDLGRSNDVIMLPPAHIRQTDYLVVESTYGNRVHDPADPSLLLAQTINETAQRGGVTIIPSFAVGRAQTMLYLIHQLKESGAISPLLPVYLNSPMAIDGTAVHIKHHHLHRLDGQQCQALHRVAKMVRSVEESIALNTQRMPMIIIAASGMATGGRVLHHLKAFAPDPRNTILFAGFQAGGTRGAAMIEGVDSIKIHGVQVPVRAQVKQIHNLSAHADSQEILDWLGHFESPPRRTFIVHGEAEAAAALSESIASRYAWQCTVPEYLESFDLS